MRMLRRTVLLLGVVLLSGNAIAKKKPQAEAPAEELRYEVTLEGLKKDELAKALEPSLRTFALQDRPPATMAQLEQRVEGDTAFITNTLRSLGFYAADVTQVITPEPLPVKVTFRVNKGPQYRLGSVTARYTVDDVSALPPLNPSLKIGHPIRAERVKGGERAMLGALANQGYPFATLVARRVDIDHDQQAIARRHKRNSPWRRIEKSPPV